MHKRAFRRGGLAAASLVTLAAALAAAPAVASAQASHTIVIDAGHGGKDPGGVGTGMQEKNVVLDVCKRFKALLDADTADDAGGGKWTALLTRSDDTYVGLSARANYANARDADRFMSIHSNAFSDPAAHGTETFAYAEGGQGAALRNLVQEEMLNAWHRTNRGNKTANFAVLRETAMPAELHELSFITNAADAAYLASADHRQEAAVAHLRAIQRHFGIQPYVPGSGDNGGGGGDTGEITGVVQDDLGPIEGAQVSLDSGQSVATGADGTFDFTDAPVGTRGITASADGHEDNTVQVAVNAGEVSDQDVTLTRRTDANGGGGADAGTGEGEPGADRVSAGCAAGGGGGAGAGAIAPLLLALVWAGRSRRRGTSRRRARA